MVYDIADDMCPNCLTPWKCNGPHESMWEQNLRIIQHELDTPWRGHDEAARCCLRAKFGADA